MTYLIREGDLTTTQGFVIRASATASVQLRKLARMGDLVWCPGCEQVGYIAEGNPTYVDQYVAVATQGHEVRCGCAPGSHRLIASVESIQADMEATISIPSDLAEVSQKAALQLLRAIQENTLREPFFSPLRTSSTPSPLQGSQSVARGGLQQAV